MGNMLLQGRDSWLQRHQTPRRNMMEDTLCKQRTSSNSPLRNDYPRPPLSLPRGQQSRRAPQSSRPRPRNKLRYAFGRVRLSGRGGGKGGGRGGGEVRRRRTRSCHEGPLAQQAAASTRRAAVPLFAKAEAGLRKFWVPRRGGGARNYDAPLALTTFAFGGAMSALR